MPLSSTPKSIGAAARCGAFLDHCHCPKTGAIALEPDDMDARHGAALARARRSGWAGDARAPKRAAA